MTRSEPARSRRLLLQNDQQRDTIREMARATVVTFTPEAGFGRLRLENGSELPFDMSTSNKRDVAVGDVCEVTVGVGRKGQPKATLVLFPLESDRRIPFVDALELLHRHRLLISLDVVAVRALAVEVLGSELTDLGYSECTALVEAHYGHGLSDLARADGVLIYDWRHGQETTTVVDDFLVAGDLAGVRIARRFEGAVELVDGGATEDIDLTGTLEPLVEWMNGALARRRRGERWYALPSGGDFEAFVLRTAAEARPPKKGLQLLVLVEGD